MKFSVIICIVGIFKTLSVFLLNVQRIYSRAETYKSQNRKVKRIGWEVFLLIWKSKEYAI